ncbi:dTMP kinase [Gemella cuniculi]|uniref:dTMP kinase n=1 Tax=Gemella cuniculi TaxID=150240 RepID=UPI000415275A|nr:dTMP kinase [Gemella cuniculi]
MYNIVIEGNDGAGKSTLIKNIKKYLISKGYKVLVVRYNMSYTTLPAIKEGKRRKFSSEVNTTLHYLSIKDQIYQYVDKFQKKGYIILWDRYIYSVVARGLSRNVNKKLISYMINDIPLPDLIIYLDISPRTAYSRLKGNVNYWESGLDVYKDEKSKKEAFIKFQENIRINFQKILSKYNIVSIIDSDEEVIEIFKKSISIILKKYEGDKK